MTSHRWLPLAALGLMAVATATAAAPVPRAVGTQLLLESYDDTCGNLVSAQVADLRGHSFNLGPGWDHNGVAVDPSGRWLAERAYPDILVVDLTTARVRAFRGDADLAWSQRGSVLLKSGTNRSSLIQNGRFIARFGRRFSSIAPDGDAVLGPSGRYHVAIAQRAHGWRPHRVGEGELGAAGWSQSGGWVAYATRRRGSGVERVYVGPVGEKPARSAQMPLGIVEQLSWSRDGRYVAVQMSRGAYPSVRVVDARSGSVRALGAGTLAGWTMRGELVLTDRATRVVSPTGLVLWRAAIATDGISGDGRWLAATRGPRGARTWAIVNLAGHAVRTVRIHGERLRAYDAPALWSPDGRVVLAGGPSRHGVFLAAAATLQARRVARIEPYADAYPVGFIHASPVALTRMRHALPAPPARARDC